MSVLVDPAKCGHEDWIRLHWKDGSLASDGNPKLTIEYCQHCGILRLDADSFLYLKRNE